MPVAIDSYFKEKLLHIVRGAVMPLYGCRAKPWWGPCNKAPGGSKDLVLWDHLLLIKIYPQQPVMKLIFADFCLIGVWILVYSCILNYIFNLWRPCAFTNYLSLCILLKHTELKSLDAQTGIMASKSPWIHLWNSITVSQLRWKSFRCT